MENTAFPFEVFFFLSYMRFFFFNPYAIFVSHSSVIMSLTKLSHSLRVLAFDIEFYYWPLFSPTAGATNVAEKLEDETLTGSPGYTQNIGQCVNKTAPGHSCSHVSEQNVSDRT